MEPFKNLVFLLACIVLMCCVGQLCVFTCAQSNTQSVSYKLTTILGAAIGDGKPATQVGTKYPARVIASPNGNIYYTDTNNNQVRYFGADGISHCLAGSPVYQGGIIDDLTLANSSLYYPIDIAFNSKGDMFIAELAGERVKRLYYNSTIAAFNMITIAGGGSLFTSNISALSSKFINPICVVVSPLDEIYICDSGSHTIRKITNDSMMYTVIGQNGVLGNSVDGTMATNALIGNVYDIAFHPMSGEMYFADNLNNVIKYVSNNGSLYTYVNCVGPKAIEFAPNGDLYAISQHQLLKYVGVNPVILVNFGGVGGFGGDGGSGLNANLNTPNGFTIYGNSVYIADSNNNRIRLFDMSLGIISTVAGDGNAKFMGSSFGYQSDIALTSPRSVFYNSQTDQVLVADTGKNRIIRINSLTKASSSYVETIAGTGVGSVDIDGKLGNQTTLLSPYSVVQSESTGDVFIGTDGLVLKLDNTNQTISTFAGSRPSISNNIPAIQAKLSNPNGLAISPFGDLYFTDYTNHIIQKIDTNGILTTIAGTGSIGFQDGPALSAKFNVPYGIVCLSNGDLLISDTFNHRIRKYTAATKTVSTVAGSSPNGAFGGDGGLATSALLNKPTGIYYLSMSGDFIVADTGNYRIRKFSVNGNITTIAGNGVSTYNGDGLNAYSTNMSPFGLALHPISGEIYYTDSTNNLVRKIDSNGFVSTIIGVPGGDTYTSISLANETALVTPTYLTFSPSGDLYVSSSNQQAIKKMEYQSLIVKTHVGLGSGSSGFSGDGKRANSTTIWSPFAIVYSGGELFFSDSDNKRIRKVDSSGIVSTIAGGIGDKGKATSATVSLVQGMTLTNTDLIFSDKNAFKIRKVSLSSGIIDSIVGIFKNPFNGNSLLANQTSISQINGLTVQDNYLIFADGDYHLIRKTSLSGEGIVSNIAGNRIPSSLNADNVPATSIFLFNPHAVSTLPGGELVIADTYANVIRKIDIYGNIFSIAGIHDQSGFNGDSNNAKTSLLNRPIGTVGLQDGRIIFSDFDNNRIRLLTPYCSEKGYSLSRGSNQEIICVKDESFSISGLPTYLVVSGNEFSFDLVISKIVVNQTVINNFLKTGNSNNTLTFSIKISAVERKGIIPDLILKNSKSGILTLFPTATISNKFTIDYGSLVSGFTASVSVSIVNGDGTTIVSSFELPINLPPQQPSTLLYSNSTECIAIKESLSLSIDPWSASSALHPLKYAISFTSSTFKNSIRITDFSTELNRSIVLPFLNETINLGIIVMDSMSNYYFNSSKLYINVKIFNGNRNEYLQIANSATLFNLVNSLVYDLSFSGTSTYYSALINVIDVSGSDPSSALSSIQQIISKTNLDELIANSTLSKLEELISHSFDRYNESKSSIGYVNSKLSDDNVNSILGQSSIIVGAKLLQTNSRELSEKLANLIILGQVANSMDASSESLNVTSYTSSNINITISSFVLNSQSSQNVNQKVQQDQVGVSFNAPYIISQNNGLASEMSISVLSYSNLFNSTTGVQSNETESSESLSISTDFKVFKDQKVLSLENLEIPIVISFKLSKSDKQLIASKFESSPNYSLSCAFLQEDTQEWSKKGCSLSNYNLQDGSIQCSCNHTTLFTTFLEQKTQIFSKSEALQVSSVYFAQIAFGCFYFLISILVLVMLILFRGEQPVASRLITPYLGISALIIETVLIYIVQRSVLVSELFNSSTDFTKGDLASNWIANIVMIIVNTMQLSAIFAYVLQVSRFQLMKYMYNIMIEVRRKKKNQDETLYSLVRNLSSKKLFIGSLSIFALINIAYWTLWVILVRTGAIAGPTYTYIVSISYIVIILTLGTIIVMVSLCDWIASSVLRFSYDRSERNSIVKLGQEPQSTKNELEKVKNKIHSLGIFHGLVSLDTPLYFRMEMILFCISFVFIILNQALGLSTLPFRYESSTAYLKILTNDMISFIFEVLYMATHILVYGGFCILVVLYSKIRKTMRNKTQTTEEDENREMTNLISNDYGARLFEEFCKKEFSTENLYLYQDLQNIKNFNNKHQTDHIYEKYVKNGADLEVNIPSECSKKFKSFVNSFETSNSMSEEVFQLLLSNVVMNLQDTFSRFVETREYQIFSKLYSVEQHLNREMKIIV